jgi:hypothetical protein
MFGGIILSNSIGLAEESILSELLIIELANAMIKGI